MHDVVLAGGAEASITRLVLVVLMPLQLFLQRKIQERSSIHLTRRPCGL